MSVVILVSNTAKSEGTNKLIDDPDQDVRYDHFLREYVSFGNAINKPRRWSGDKVCVNCRPIL